MSSLLVIGKVGIQDFFKKHDKNLSKASLLGKIYIAISVAPLFVFVALFRVGSFAFAFAEGQSRDILLFLAILPPALGIFLVKICLPLKDLSAATISQGVFAEMVSLHSWPTEPMGKVIEWGMGTYSHLLHSFFLTVIIRNDRTDLFLKDNEIDVDLKNVAIFCLAVGWVTFPFIMCLIAYEETLVKYVAAKHPKDREQKNAEKVQEEHEALEGDV